MKVSGGGSRLDPQQGAGAVHALPGRGGAGGLVICLLLAAILRVFLLWSLDLRGGFGPDAPGAIAAAASPLSHPYPLHPALIRLFSLLTGEPGQAALLVSLAASLALTAAAWSLGRTFFGSLGGLAAGCLVATTPLVAFISLLRGGDALALALAWWGVALALGGARRGASGLSPGVVAAMLAGGLLWGSSAAAKPVGLPAGVLLLAAPLIGGRRVLWPMAASFAAGAALASPFLGPLLRPRVGQGLMGSWWAAGLPAGPVEWLTIWARGVPALVELVFSHPWSQLGPLALLAGLGLLVRGEGRSTRAALLVLGLLASIGPAALMGEALRPRYLASGTIGLVLASTWILQPGWRHRGGALPMAVVLALFTLSSARLWGGLGHLRAGEDLSAPPRGPLGGLEEDLSLLPQLADSTICGALELERLAEGLAARLPPGSTVAYLPLRDGRDWHLVGPLAAGRPDLTVLPLDRRCCPGGPDRCADLLLPALGDAGGGALVAPLEDGGPCRNGVVSAEGDEWVEALYPLLATRGAWFGAVEISGAGEAHLCRLLGGAPPVPAASPWRGAP